MSYIVLDQCKVNCVLNFKANATSVTPKANLKIFLFPLTRPCFSGKGPSVGKKNFLTSQIPYQLNLIVNCPNIGNKTKCTNDANKKYFI